VQVSAHTCTDNESVCIRALACTRKRGVSVGCEGSTRARTRPCPHEGGDGDSDGDDISAVVSSWGE
jgi:hypothetical protein